MLMATELTVCVFSFFQGGWQMAELSTRAYERRPWFCDNVTGMKTIKNLETYDLHMHIKKHTQQS